MTEEELKAPDCPSKCMDKMVESRKAGGHLRIICECEWMTLNPYHKGLKGTLETRGQTNVP